jgi:hypothetical protein
MAWRTLSSKWRQIVRYRSARSSSTVRQSYSGAGVVVVVAVVVVVLLSAVSEAFLIAPATGMGLLTGSAWWVVGWWSIE